MFSCIKLLILKIVRMQIYIKNILTVIMIDFPAFRSPNILYKVCSLIVPSASWDIKMKLLLRLAKSLWNQRKIICKKRATGC